MTKCSNPIAGVFVYEFPVVDDPRGKLTVGEFENEIPFNPKRYFMVFDVPASGMRGEHAHKECHQLLLCVKGSCSVIADNGIDKFEMVLDHPRRGLHLSPCVWGIQYKYSSDAVLLVFASHLYDPSDYIRDYEEFTQFLKNIRPPGGVT